MSFEVVVCDTDGNGAFFIRSNSTAIVGNVNKRILLVYWDATFTRSKLNRFIHAQEEGMIVDVSSCPVHNITGDEDAISMALITHSDKFNILEAKNLEYLEGESYGDLGNQ